jgi:asparagine N-glycosylation enzyme membrane subunit Stt3
MHDDDVREEIARLEAQLEVLRDALERCRKLALASRLAIAAGAVLILLMVVGVLPLARLNLLGALAAVIGGIVLFGSNSSTWKQTAAAIKEAEALRAELIESMELRVVDDSPPIH